jgi:hypothetical protein
VGYWPPVGNKDRPFQGIFCHELTIGIFVGTVVCYLLFSGLAHFSAMLSGGDISEEKQPTATPNSLERSQTADNPFPTDPVLKAGKLLFKCPTCPNIVSVTQQQIDPIIGVNVACSGKMFQCQAALIQNRRSRHDDHGGVRAYWQIFRLVLRNPFIASLFKEASQTF